MLAKCCSEFDTKQKFLMTSELVLSSTENVDSSLQRFYNMEWNYKLLGLKCFRGSMHCKLAGFTSFYDKTSSYLYVVNTNVQHSSIILSGLSSNDGVTDDGYGSDPGPDLEPALSTSKGFRIETDNEDLDY